MAVQAPDSQIIADAIKLGVTERVGKAYDERVKELIEQLEKDKDRIVTGIVLNLMESVSFTSHERELIITIKKFDNPR